MFSFEYQFKLKSKLTFDDLHLGNVTYVDFAPQSLIFEKFSRSEDVPDMTPEPYNSK